VICSPGAATSFALTAAHAERIASTIAHEIRRITSNCNCVLQADGAAYVALRRFLQPSLHASLIC
jgi:hypothetical protein